MLRYIFFVFMIGLGVVLGIFFAEQVYPVEVQDAPLNTLREDYQTDYVLMVAESYAQYQDPELAALQLGQLSSAKPVETVNLAIVFALENGYTPNDLVLLQKLSEVMSTWDPNLAEPVMEENDG
jgi:hypothetical protein